MTDRNGTVEVLVIVEDEEVVEFDLKQHIEIVHRCPPRVLVGHTSDDEVETLRQAPGVTGVFIDRVPSVVRSTLNEAETAFVTAWHQRETASSSDRRGDDLDWDAPGFEPPDDVAEDSKTDSNRTNETQNSDIDDTSRSEP